MTFTDSVKRFRKRDFKLDVTVFDQFKVFVRFSIRVAKVKAKQCIPFFKVILTDVVCSIGEINICVF